MPVTQLSENASGPSLQDVDPATLPANDIDDATGIDNLRHRLILLIGITIALIVIAWRGTTWYWHVAIGVWTSYIFLCATSLFHECTHRHDLALWRFLAKLIGTFILTPARVYRESHVRHHAYLNRPIDWELWPYSDPTTSRTFRRVFAWADLVFGVVMSPWIYGRIYWHKDSPLSPAARREITIEYSVMALFWGAVLTAVTVYGQWLNFLIAWGMPWYTAGILQSGRKFTEHLGMASYDPMYGTRTVFGGNIVTQIASWLNSDIFVHGPHHRAPRINADELKEFAADCAKNRSDLPFFKSYAAAVWHMLPHFLWNPGVGENSSDWTAPTQPTAT